MVLVDNFVAELEKNNIRSVIEVPCSIFKDLINFLLDTKKLEILNPVNEAVVMAQAAGEFLSSRKLPLVMMQNSGLNNTLNCLTSLNKQYKIPALYLISWRGESNDAPEHSFMGANLGKILSTFQIPFKILTPENYGSEIRWAASLARQTEHPTALIMKKGLISKYPRGLQPVSLPLDRWQAVQTIVENTDNCLYVSTNGFPSRVLYNLLKQKGKEDGRAFYMVGSMGHALGIGQGIAKNLPKSKVIVLDGDGGALMHLGSMAGVKKYNNLIHIVLDNRVYGSTGGQPTLSSSMDFKKISEGFGYSFHHSETKEELVNAVKSSLADGPALIHVEINPDEKNEKEMERVAYSCEQIKKRFEKYLERFK